MVGDAFRAGEAVRILDGAFVNFVGVVRSAATATGMVTVAVGVQDREVLVEVDHHRLERIR